MQQVEYAHKSQELSQNVIYSKMYIFHISTGRFPEWSCEDCYPIIIYFAQGQENEASTREFAHVQDVLSWSSPPAVR